MRRKGVGGSGSGFILLLALLGFALALVSPSVAAAPVASVEIVGSTTPEMIDEPLEVKLPEARAGGPATLDVPLLVNDPGTLLVTYTDLASRKAVPIGPPREMSKDELSVDASLPTAPLAAGEVYVLHLDFTPPKAHPEEVEGVLSVRTGQGAPLARRVEVGSGDAPSAWVPAQSKIEISATRPFFFFSIPDVSRTIGLSGSGPTATGEPLREAVVTLSDSGNGRLSVDSPESSRRSVKKAKLELSDVSGVGTATTKFDLGSEEKPSQQLEVVVKVGDSVLMPLLVILIAALIGKLGPTLWDVRRRGGALRSKLKEAVDAHDAAVELPPIDLDAPEQVRPIRLGLVGIADRVGPQRVWPGGLRLLGRAKWWGHEDLAKADNRSAAAIYFRLGRANYTADLEAEATAAADLINLIEGWLSVRKALVALAEALRKAETESLDPNQAPLQDSGDLVARKFEIDSDVDKSAKLAKAIGIQQNALAVLAEIESRQLSLSREVLDFGEFLAISGALEIYLETKPPLLRSEEEGEVLVERLREILFRLSYAEQEASAGRPTTEVRAALFSLSTPDIPSPRQVLSDLFEFVAPTKAPSPEKVMAGIRRGDWLVFIAVLLISSLAYLLPVYAGGPFGSCQQYLAAFIAGAGSQVAISGALIPLTRTSAAAEAKEEKPAAPAAAAA